MIVLPLLFTWMATPSSPFAFGERCPVGSVPMKSSWIVSCPATDRLIPSPVNRLIARPLTVVIPALMSSPSTPVGALPAPAPSSSIRGVEAVARLGRAVDRDRDRHRRQRRGDRDRLDPGEPILKSIVFGPVVALDWPIAHRSDPIAVSSLVFVTVNVESKARRSIPSTTGLSRRADVRSEDRADA